jgi:hypothetical protein
MNFYKKHKKNILSLLVATICLIATYTAMVAPSTTPASLNKETEAEGQGESKEQALVEKKEELEGQLEQIEEEDKRRELEKQKLELEKQLIELELSGEEDKEAKEEPTTESDKQPAAAPAAIEEQAASSNLNEHEETLGDWQGLVDYAIANPFKGTVFTEGEYKGNHLQIAKDLRMQHYQGVQGCHPYILAALHYSETGLQMSNGNNGQGVFQAYSSGIRYTPNSYPDNFKEQAQQACNTLRNKIGGADLSTLGDLDTIGIALAKYNGCWSPGSQMFANESMHSATPWTLCPYTANKMNEHTQGMRQCATDGCGSVNTRKTYGTIAFIAHLLSLH